MSVNYWFRRVLVIYARLFIELGNVAHESDAAVQATKREALEKETIPFYLEKLDEVAKANDGHFALGRVRSVDDSGGMSLILYLFQQLTWADVFFTALLDTLNFFVKRDMIEGYPNLKAVTENVLAIDSIKEWVAKRPTTDL